jgi:hypothetical protein
VYPSSSRRDFVGGAVWAAFGSLVTVLSWRMDRMTDQGATLHTAPGLWPAIIGIVLAALGGILMLRSWRRAATIGWDAAEKEETDYAPARSFALAVALFFIYALLLVGRGLPFWLGTALFVTAFVVVFQFGQRKASGSVARGVVVAVACGAITSAAVTYLFEHLFYVRLP